MDAKRPQTVETTELVLRTRQLLSQRPNWMSYTRIEKDTGLKASWVNMFARAKNDPTASKVIKLYEYLTNSKLQIA